MLRIFAGAIVATLALLLPACGSVTSPVNVKQVLTRALDAFEKFDDYMTSYSYTAMTPELFAQFKVWLDNEMNRSPALYNKRIATRINADASIDGFADDNANGKIDATEPRLFKIEIDIDNRRVIATAEGSSSYDYHPRPRGFIAGYLVSDLLNRQRRAGIRYGHFSKRTVYASGIKRPDPSDTTARSTTTRHRPANRSRLRTDRNGSHRHYSNARSKARSGGAFGGK
jgi:hypothetical protein